MIENVQSLFVFVVFLGMIVYGMYRTYILNKTPNVRKIPAVEAFDEGIGLAMETGKKVQYAIPTMVIGRGAEQTLISLAIMGYFARKVAKLSVPIVYTCATAPTLALMQGVVRDAYVAEGKAEDYENPDIVDIQMIGPGLSYGGEEETAHALAYPGLLQRENVGFSIYSGGSGKNLLFYGEAGREANCFQICFNPTSSKLSWAIASFDYVLMMSECYVVGAMVSEDKAMLGSVIGTDIITWTVFALCIIFMVAATALGTTLENILVG